MEHGVASVQRGGTPDGGVAVVGVTQAILGRRSVRDGFRSDAVAPDIISRIVECGLAAPSSKNARPWALHVVTDRALMHAAAEAARSSPEIEGYVPHDPATGQPRTEYSSTVLESCGVLESVPLAIFIENRGPFSSGHRRMATASSQNREAALMGYGLEMLGIGAAIQNLWLAANDNGLSAAFLGDLVIAEWPIKELLKMKGDLVGVLALGYADTATERPARAPSADSLVTYHSSAVTSQHKLDPSASAR